MPAHVTLSRRQLRGAIGAVALGGALGTLARDLSLTLDPTSHSRSWVAHVPWALLVINVVGVFVATALLRGPLRHHDPNDAWRLLWITGVLGGFTSYSSLFVALGEIWHLSVLAGIGTGTVAVASGVAAAAVGLRVRWRPR
ncbi:MAG: fluoride efflux transporter FluC [Acidimicrobiales bacterium]